MRKVCFAMSSTAKKIMTMKAPTPAREYFLDRFASKDKVEKVDAFLEEEKGKVFNFRERIHRYVLQDVEIQRGGCLALLKEFFEFQEEFDKKLKVPLHIFSRPFFTSSSVVHALWRTYGPCRRGSCT